MEFNFRFRALRIKMGGGSNCDFIMKSLCMFHVHCIHVMISCSYSDLICAILVISPSHAECKGL